MVFFWVMEALPMAITSLIPIFAFPLLGVMSSSAVCSAYVTETILLFLGGLVVAVAVEHSNLHKRIALFVILHIGQSPRKLLFGVMLTTMFLSMWISNTASTAMMVPIVDAVLKELYKTVEMKDLEHLRTDDRPAKQCAEEEEALNPKYTPEITLTKYGENIYNPEETNVLYKEDIKEHITEIPEEKPKTSESVDFKTLKTMYFLGVAYSANVGGTGSLTGTGPNLVVKGVLDNSFEHPTGLNFGTWLAFNVPGVILCTLCCCIWLQFFFIGFGSRSKLPATTKEKEEKVKQLIKDQYKSLGRISFHESSVLTIFVTLVLLWMFRDPGFIPGWAYLVKMNFPNITVGDAVPAILATVFLFIIPCEPNFWPSARHKDGPSRGCLTWREVHEKIPWGVILLLGGGFAMAKGCNDSGLSVFIGEKLKFIGSLSPSFSVLIISISTALATEVASNTATASILMPIMNELALKMCVNPLYLMLPAGVCCSYAFMLPIATPPNAVVYGAAGGDMKASVMIKAGIVMNILCVLIINVLANTLGEAMFHFGEMPSWANSTSTQHQFEICLNNSLGIDL
ncbi:Solute carrier family 13 member 3 [Armadillidium vulgare]|nr:Solute carrier family 13 member 3 [Armadillidium vulgare]